MPTLPLDVATVLAKIAALVFQVCSKKNKKKNQKTKKQQNLRVGETEENTSRDLSSS